MIVYGDASTVLLPNDRLEQIRETFGAALRQTLPIKRHAGIIDALIAAGELAQGLADACFDKTGYDDIRPETRAVSLLLHRLASLACASWASVFAEPLPEAGLKVDRLCTEASGLGLGKPVTIRRPEGFAHYALYPEAYWQAAAGSGLSADTQVVGIRSIGTSLAAMVAVALRAGPPITVRPNGHPFAREVRIGPAMDRTIQARVSSTWAIVDEGPGLSGSSFGGVADALEQRGVPEEALAFFPSHAGPPGPQASQIHRDRWARRPRFSTGFEPLVLAAEHPAQRLEAWAADVTGPPLEPLRDIAGGRWRALFSQDEASWPPSDAQNERRKYLLRAQSGTFLLKFAGLGAAGRDTYARAKALATAGFTIAPLALRHGFTVEPWRDDLRPLDPARLDRPVFLNHLARYLAFRAGALPAAAGSGSTLAALLEMTLHNARERFGDRADGLASWGAVLPELQGRIRPVCTDNRLQSWEWLEARNGTWIKADAADHCAGHDLVGCQDIAWDVAGASVEFNLGMAESTALLTRVDRATGRSTDPRLPRFFRCAYAAFWLGMFSMARDRSEGAEARRLGAAADRYAAVLSELFERSGPGPWPRSD